MRVARVTPVHPDRMAEMYLRRLRPYLTELHRLTTACLERAAAISGIIMDSNSARASDALDGVKSAMSYSWPPKRLAGVVRHVGVETVKLGERNVSRLTGIEVRGVASQEAVSDWVGVNVDLIRTVEDRYLSQVRDLVSEGFESGDRWESISKKLQERADVSRSNADRIARDQCSKLNAEVSREAMERLGVKRCIWRTMGDSRVRDEHAELDGVEYDIGEGVMFEGGRIWPGSEIQCRCYAEPVIEFGVEPEKKNQR